MNDTKSRNHTMQAQGLMQVYSSMTSATVPSAFFFVTQIRNRGNLQFPLHSLFWRQNGRRVQNLNSVDAAIPVILLA